MQPKNRFFANLSYETFAKDNGAQWKVDLTFNSIGKQRLPDTSTNPIQYQLPAFSDSFQLLNTQITRVFSKKLEIYFGGENITNVQQKNPILASDSPFGTRMTHTPAQPTQV